MKKVSLILMSCFSVLQLAAQTPTNKVATSQKFEEVLMYINKMYVDTVNDVQLTEAAITGMLEKLDPHSTYISKEEVDEANQSINGSFVGIGIRFQILKDTLMVVATIPGGPSEKLGIQPGDKITMIANENVAGIGLKNNQVREKLMGELGSKVQVQITRKNMKKPLDFVIMRDNIPIHSVDAYYMLTPEIGYIKLNSFSRTTVEEMQRALKALKDLGMKDLIFDLQDNGGGLLYAAQQLADEFLSGEKLVVYSEGRSQPRNDLKAGKKGLWEDGRIVVLTDEYSASASEIVSGAIQDWDRGVVVGRRTYGKGLVQRPIDLTDGSQIRLTIARYYTPSGRWIQKPYDDVKEYRNDIANRLEHGELSNVDSIKFPDSLKYYTLVNKRLVYGGGGIMPDVFVGIDTSGITEYYRNLIQKGHLTTFLLDYVDKQRNSLMEKYPSFESFKNTFEVDKNLLNQFFKYVEKEDSELKYNEEQFKTSEQLFKVRMKAVLAQDLWGFSEFYQIANEDNNIVQRAVKVLQENDYDQLLKK